MTDRKEEESPPPDSIEATTAKSNQESDERDVEVSRTDNQSADNQSAGNQSADDQGPGWLPAILAAMALMGIVGFIACAFSTWMLFQKRTEFAIRTLKGDYIAQLDQSLLDPDSKAACKSEIESLIGDLEGGKYENWQSAAIMQRLQRLPVFQWGEVQAIEAHLRNAKDDSLSPEAREEGLKQLGRLQRGVELGKVTSFDFQDVLEPVREPSPSSPTGMDLVRPLKAASIEDVTRRAKELADRTQIPDQSFSNIRIEDILGREIEQGGSEGGY